MVNIKANRVKAEELVTTQEVKTDIGPVYIINIADINLRTYLSKEDADKNAIFMKIVVDAILSTGKGVEVKELKREVPSDIPMYLLSIGGINSRAYLSKAETIRTVDYMTKIVNAVKEKGST